MPTKLQQVIDKLFLFSFFVPIIFPIVNLLVIVCLCSPISLVILFVGGRFGLQKLYLSCIASLFVYPLLRSHLIGIVPVEEEKLMPCPDFNYSKVLV